MAEHVHFNFMTASMSAYDAANWIRNAHLDGREYQLCRAADGDPHHEIEFRLDSEAFLPGEPISPLIKSAELSPSKFYVEFRFDETPVYMTIPATSTVTLGWLEREKHDV